MTPSEPMADNSPQFAAAPREQLGRLGGNARFRAPGKDADNRVRHGQAPTTRRVALVPWWFKW